MRGRAIQRRTEPEEQTALVVIADVSGSMRGDKIRRLRRELESMWSERKASLLAFSDSWTWVDGPTDLPEPGGGTYMAEALEEAAKRWPSEVLLISDGRPQNEESAIAAAEKIPGVISVLFVGGEADEAGAEFMRRLARVGGGVMVHKDLAKATSIESTLRELLALPAPIILN